ncbi:MAG: RT0821/Lpp0805 family surface protein [Deferrisomatales bacterium]|nr:RT0821/Lpp0805 family surface protein [Deferrisomatales bacterium]
MGRRRVVVAVLAAALVAGTLPAAAGDRGGGKGKPGHPHGGKGIKVKVDHRGGGPPPWAPAHGYRRHGAAPAGAVYVAPFQIDLGRCNRGTLGAVLGGAAGGAAGAQVGGGKGRDAAIIGGTIIGVIVGQRIGRWMDEVDQACVGQTLEHAPSGRPVEWVNPDNGVVYQVTPTEAYRIGEDLYCREFQTEAQIGGRTERLYGTACRQPDGAWERASR